MANEIGSVPKGSQAASLKVLVLDDNDVDRQRLVRLLDRMGLRPECTQAATLIEFAQKLRFGSYDLILIDYFLGASTGLDALESLKIAGNQQTAATIMITGQGRIDLAVEAMRMGCDDYIMKDLLSVEMLQKSVLLSMERRLLYAAINDNDGANAALRDQLARFAGAATADMKAILSSMLRRTREMRQTNHSDPKALTQISGLEGSCNEMWSFLGEFENSVVSHLPPKRRTPRLGLRSMARHSD